MCKEIPIVVYLQITLILIGIVAFAVPIVIAIAGFSFTRQFSNRIDSVASV
ncbi:MAG: hypothetical protein OXC62_16185 [Aestuariivita sp.]|nr:hypothetical protein [Aestuariivita sp.]